MIFQTEEVTPQAIKVKAGVTEICQRSKVRPDGVFNVLPGVGTDII